MVGNIMNDYHGADGILIIFGFIIFVAFLYVVWFTFIVVKLLMVSLFQNIFVTSSPNRVSSRKYRVSNVNPNDFWDEPDMGTYVTMPNGDVRID
jgi:hypothetical protein